jgi:hypothetical protein
MSADRGTGVGRAVDRLAAALRAHLDARRRAEVQLASFAFTEQPSPATRDEAGPDPADLRWFLARVLRAAGEPGTLRLLEALRAGPVSIDAARDLDPAAPGRLGVVERIGDLAAAGLVARELGRDEVSLAPLGVAVLDLVSEIERCAAADAS